MIALFIRQQREPYQLTLLKSDKSKILHPSKVHFPLRNQSHKNQQYWQVNKAANYQLGFCYLKAKNAHNLGAKPCA